MKLLFPPDKVEENNLVDTIIVTAKLMGYTIKERRKGKRVAKLKLRSDKKYITIYVIQQIKNYDLQCKICHDITHISKWEQLKTKEKEHIDVLKEILVKM